MKARFEVHVARFSVLKELEGVWRTDDFLALLDLMEFGDTSRIDVDELRDMCLLSLQDLQPREAAARLLQYKLGEKLSEGEVRNMSTEIEIASSEVRSRKRQALVGAHFRLLPRIATLLPFTLPRETRIADV